MQFQGKVWYSSYSLQLYKNAVSEGERRREQLSGPAGAEHLVCTCPVCSSMLVNDGLISVSSCRGTSAQATTLQSLGEGSTVLLVYKAVQ